MTTTNSALRQDTDLRARIAALGPWFHNMEIAGIETAPDHFLGDYPTFKWRGFSHVLPDDLEGRSVLDIGCNAGFFSREMHRRNAGRIVAIDSDPRYLQQAALMADQEGIAIEFRQMSVYDVAALGERFDLVLFTGVLYHLRHPLLALDLIHQHVADDLLLFQCLQRGSDRTMDLAGDYGFDTWDIFSNPDFPALFFIEERYAGDPTNWFFPNRAAVEAMLRSAGFAAEAHPEREVYLCRRSDRPAAAEPPPVIRSRLG